MEDCLPTKHGKMSKPQETAPRLLSIAPLFVKLLLPFSFYCTPAAVGA